MELWIKNVKFGLIHHSLPFINLQQKKDNRNNFYATQGKGIRYQRMLFFAGG